MHNATLNDEILEYISLEEFDKLLSVPKITENDIKFKKAKDIKELLSEFSC